MQMQLFKGYVKTKNKQCVEPFKDRTDLKTLEQVQQLSEYAGILGEETVLIDIDDAETSELLFKIVQDFELKCRVFASTRSTDGGIFKVKNENKNPEKFANSPEVCFIVNASVNDKHVPPYLDRGWYIDLAWKRLKDFGVVL